MTQEIIRHRIYDTGVLSPGEIFTVWGARAFHLYDPEGHRIEFWPDV